MTHVAASSFLKGKGGAVDLGEREGGALGRVEGEKEVLEMYCMREGRINQRENEN